MDTPDPFHLRLHRRELLGRAGAVVGALGAAWLHRARTVHAEPAAAAAAGGPRHLSWVWQFSEDGAPDAIRPVLAAAGMGVVIKTHDATEWMGRFDPSPHAVSGPERFSRLVRFFEDGGVPVHAWCVVTGQRPVQEAALAAQVLAAGARSLFIDLEPHPGFWVGGPQEALLYGQELRRLRPQARLSLSIDPRPWHLDRIPLREFAGFCNEVSPQVYWDDFNSHDNWLHFVETGYGPPREGVTAAFIIDAGFRALVPLGLPVHPIGQGDSAGPSAWQHLLDRSYAQGAGSVSVWRHGLVPPELWQVLRSSPPTAAHGYAVQPGDTLSELAAGWGVSVQAVMAANGISNPNRIFVGQTLQVPRGGGGSPAPPAPRPATAPTARRARQAAGATHVVQPGDTLTSLAERWNTSVARIAEANGVADPDMIYVGMKLLVP